MGAFRGLAIGGMIVAICIMLALLGMAVRDAIREVGAISATVAQVKAPDFAIEATMARGTE